VPADRAKVTIHQLLTHTGGIPNPGFGDEYVDVTKERALSALFTRPLRFAPGSRFEYSNGGYILLAAIVERASGERFMDFVRREVFQRAGMIRTGYYGALAPRVPRTDVALGHDETGVILDPLKFNPETWQDMGAGQVLSTVEDLFRFHVALKDNILLPADEMRRVWTPVLPEAVPTYRFYTSDYGYGWWIQPTRRGTTRIRHGGDTRAFGSEMVWFRDEGVVVIGLTNIRHDWFPTQSRVGRVIPAIVFGESFADPPVFERSQPSSLRAFEGEFQLQSGATLVITFGQTGLYIGADGQEAADALRPADEKELLQRAAFTTAADKVFRGAVARDFDAMAQALSNAQAAVAWKQGWPDEEVRLAGDFGAFESLKVLGTVPSGLPDTYRTHLRFNFARGSAFYLVRWDEQGRLWFADVSGVRLAALTPIQPTGASAFVGWDIGSWTNDGPFYLSFSGDPSRPDSLTVQRGERRWAAKRKR
jgi:hypothetical protein